MKSSTRSKYGDRIETLFKNAREKKYAKNQIIGYQGDLLSSIYQVKEGYVKAYTILDSGDTRTIFLLGPGDIFPVAFSLTLDWSKYQLKYFYQALTDTRLVALDSHNFQELLESDPQIVRTYLSYMSASNEAIMDQLEAMKRKNARDKIFELLPYLVKKIGRRIRPHTYKLNLKLSHQEIADLSGITRETTTSLLKKLEREGVIKQQRNTWVIHLEPDQEEHLRG